MLALKKYTGELESKACSLKQLGIDVTRGPLMQLFLENLDSTLLSQTVIADINERLYLKGQNTNFVPGRDEGPGIDAIIQGISEDGGIIIDCAGVRRIEHAGNL